MSSNWWANKLGTTPVPQAQPQQQQPYVPPTVNVGQQGTPPVQQTYTPSPRCPGCGSGNYGASAMTPEARPRCYDCGYPIQQSGSGVGKGIQSGQSSGGPAAPARQVTPGGFNPTTIIGHI
jgi:hypothetical protein